MIMASSRDADNRHMVSSHRHACPLPVTVTRLAATPGQANVTHDQRPAAVPPITVTWHRVIVTRHRLGVTSFGTDRHATSSVSSRRPDGPGMPASWPTHWTECGACCCSAHWPWPLRRLASVPRIGCATPTHSGDVEGIQPQFEAQRTPQLPRSIAAALDVLAHEAVDRFLP
jgi:hypothetical protein